MDKLQIARNLEYVAGGMDALRRVCAGGKGNEPFIKMLDEWREWIFDALDLVLEDKENATNT